MRQNPFKSDPKKTAFVMIDTHKCKACWQCITVCPQNKLSRINLPWHKHARLTNHAECIACMRCVKECAANAIVKQANTYK